MPHHIIDRKGCDEIPLTDASLPAKKRILTACVRLFLEKGYKKTTVADIVHQADVSNSTFQNIFRAKDGVLTELVKFMFGNQFSIARGTVSTLPPVYVYAVETSVQLTLLELNENLREIYLEAYTHEEALSFIHHTTAAELYRIFGSYQPELSEEDFFSLEIGSAGLMRGYMAYPCTDAFPLVKKLHSFLAMSLSAYKVPEDEQQRVFAFIAGLDIRAISRQAMDKLFHALSMRYEFSPENLISPDSTPP